MTTIYGYFDDPAQDVPAFDPGLTVTCPICQQMLTGDALCHSFMAPGDTRSYFWRYHRRCAEGLPADWQDAIDELMVHAIYLARERN